LNFSHQQESKDLTRFFDELPKRLQIEVSLFVYESFYRKIEFLHERSSSFVAWICPHLRPVFNSDSEYVYFEGDEITSIYFLNKGRCGLVLPRHKNLLYISFHEGCNFGLVDVIGSVMKYDIPFEGWMQQPEKMKR